MHHFVVNPITTTKLFVVSQLVVMKAFSLIVDENTRPSTDERTF